MAAMEDNPFKRMALENKKARQAVAEAHAAEAAAEAKARALAQRKASRAPEDNWFHDGVDDAFASDSDEEELKMVDPMLFLVDDGVADCKPTGEAPKITIKNLIDFGECNVPKEEERGFWSNHSANSLIKGSAASLSSPTPPGLACGAATVDHFDFGIESSLGDVAFRQLIDMQMGDEKLIAEIDTLKHLLSTANDEKQIQIEIIIEDKQNTIDDLRRQVDALSLRLQADPVEGLKVEALNLREEVTKYRGVAEASALELADLTAATKRPPTCAGPVAEVKELQAELVRVNVQLKDVDALRAEIRSLREQLDTSALEVEELKSLVSVPEQRSLARYEAELLRRNVALTTHCKNGELQIGAAVDLLPQQESMMEAGPMHVEIEAEASRFRAVVVEWEVEFGRLRAGNSKLQSELAHGQAAEKKLAARFASELGTLQSKEQELENAKAQIHELQAENRCLEQQAKVLTVPSALVALLIDTRALAISMHEKLSVAGARLVLPAQGATQSMDDVESQVKDIRTLMARAHSDADIFCNRRKSQASYDAAKAMREVRLEAERKLSWLTRKTRLGGS